MGLRIIEKRKDGFHNIETLMYPLPFCDVLEFKSSDTFRLNLHGIPFQGKNETNILSVTWQFLRERYAAPPIDVHLLKAIPAGSGLGGGSSDAAFLIKTVNDYFSLGIDKDEMKLLAARIGSDCPFFIESKPSIISGRGEILESISFTLSGKFLVLVIPEINISTKKAYALINTTFPKKPLKEIVSQPIASWKGELVNDFEEPIFEIHPQLKQIKKGLYQNGATYASMTGSGSAVYGIFEKEIPTDFLPNNATTWSAYL